MLPVIEFSGGARSSFGGTHYGQDGGEEEEIMSENWSKVKSFVSARRHGRDGKLVTLCGIPLRINQATASCEHVS